MSTWTGDHNKGDSDALARYTPKDITNTGERAEPDREGSVPQFYRQV
ncbi:MAG: hypothetical protein PF447_08300 [Spirochaetaceae bacterium]|nr:hypothetical protein [Spirochaetaceae bacterium]